MKKFNQFEHREEAIGKINLEIRKHIAELQEELFGEALSKFIEKTDTPKLQRDKVEKFQ